MNGRDWVDWIAVGANILSSLGIFAAFIIYRKTRLNEIKDNKKEIEIKNQLVFTEVRKACIIYRDIVDEMRELSSKIKDIGATAVDGVIHNDKHLFLLITNEDKNKHYSMNITINYLGRLNDMLFHGVFLSHQANEALRSTINMCEAINSYITSVYQKIIFSENLPMNAKIFTLEGYSSIEIYKKHHELINNAMQCN